MRTWIRIAFFVLLTLVAPGIPATGSPAQALEGDQQFANLGDFKLENGSVIHDFRIGYRTLGKLNADKSNTVLWPTWLGGTSQDLLAYIGPGKVVDPDKYYVVLVDSIADGVSSSPSNSKDQPRMKFPEFAIRDMVEAEHRLLTDVLHLSHLRAVMGISMGGMQTFTWALTHPDFLDLAIPMMGSPQSTSYDKLQWTAEIDALESDPAWNHGNPTKPLTEGFFLATEIELMNSTSPEYRVEHTDVQAFGSFLSGIKKHVPVDGGAACNRIRQMQAIIALDTPKELGLTLEQSAKQIHAKVLVVVSPQDHMVNPIPATKLATQAGFPVVTLDSACGHVSPACISLGPTVARFLADPSSVHSVTLKEQATP